jgi:hypothetical protein
VSALLPIEFVATRPSDECGCPEEEWLIGSITLTLHNEPDGSIHAFLDSGDWDAEQMFPDLRALDAARPAVFDWAQRFIMGDAE